MKADSPPTQTCPKCKQPVEGLPNFCPHCGDDLRGLTPLSDTLSGVAEGRLIDGRYRLREKLGEGGMGAVYKVEHVRMGKVCALKLLRPEVATDKKLKSRFHQEARVVSKLSSANTIQVFDFGELEDGSLYLAMEYVSGRDLAWMLRAQGPFSEEKVLAIGIQVLSSLSEAHEQGVIHRDIKPANVMLVKRRERDDLVKVLDFGIAKLHEGEDRKHITGAADFIGTPLYMSPEQAKGETLDPRSDLYSVGAMLFELVCGRPPFEAPTPMGIVTKHLNETPPRLQQVAPERIVSPAFEQIIRRALAKDREDRFGSADEMREALERVHRTLGQLPNDFTPLPDQDTAEMARREDFDRFERSLRWRRTLVPLLTLMLIALGGYYGFKFWSSGAMPDFHPAAEQEPNEVPQQASVMKLGDALSGSIGPSTDPQTSDIDVYKLTFTERTPLTVSVSGVEGLNLVLDAHWLKNGAGKDDRPERVLLVDDGPVNQGERVDGLVVEPGTLFIRIQERAHPLELDQHRPPREKSLVNYELKVSRLDASGGTLEREPNDTLKTAQKVEDAEKPLIGFTGAYVPRTAATRDQSWSTHDFFAVKLSAKDVVALVIPPLNGRIEAQDGSLAESAPARGKLNADGTAPCTSPCVDKPTLVPLSATEEGYVLRVQAAENSVEAGAEYRVAFLSGEAHGLDAAISLASTLSGTGKTRIAAEVLQLAVQQFPNSPQVHEAESLLEKLKPLAEDVP